MPKSMIGKILRRELEREHQERATAPEGELASPEVFEPPTI
jgi:hypothetical protein